MKGRHIILDRIGGRDAAALMVDGQLQDLIIAPDDAIGFAPGAVLRGRADRLMKGQGGVFVRLPGGATGYLRDRAGIAEGKPLLVQVAGVAESGKAIPLTSRLVLKGRYGIVTPGVTGVNVSRRLRDPDLRDALTEQGAALIGNRPIGLILRSAAAEADAQDIADDLAPLIALSERLDADRAGEPELLVDAPAPWDQAWTEWAEPAPDQVDDAEGSFDDLGVTEAIAALLAPVVPLPGGANAVIEPTRALVAIDLNTGADTTPAAGLKANIALARDLPRQLRLRGLGGQIVVDFAPMPKRDRAVLDQVLRAAFKGESAETTLIGWTAMGLYELSRKRDRAPLARLAAHLDGGR